MFSTNFCLYCLDDEGDIVTLKNYMNVQYFGEIGIDTPFTSHLQHGQLQPLGSIRQMLLLGVPFSMHVFLGV
jgi:hypothetical protein